MDNDFALAFKSNIDKILFDLAQTNNLALVDLDDTVTSAELFESNKTAFVWEFLTMDEAPIYPLYAFAFRVGVRTLKDSANYTSLGLIGDIKNVLPPQKQIDIFNYSGAVASGKVGNMFITSIGLDPQLHDKASTMRMVLVNGRAVSD